MDEILRKLFDYQHFEHNTRLQKVTDNVSYEASRRLNEDELELVNAAGDVNAIYGSRLADEEKAVSPELPEHLLNL